MSAIRRWAAERTRHAAVLAASLVCTLGVAPPALAQQTEGPPTALGADEGARLELVQRDGISLQQAVAIATRRYNGRVVKAEPTTRNGRLVYEIRILIEEENRVRTVRIDAANGEER
jgi:uncharacterized membrane protein YkoI